MFPHRRLRPHELARMFSQELGDDDELAAGEAYDAAVEQGLARRLEIHEDGDGYDVDVLELVGSAGGAAA